ncbi:MAG: amino acid ABC transporter permease [Hyphomicrobiales bacterium]|jgi:polar amino acid transport system permease protein|nr:amino acid ABC transporter permease [Hyphomicrobiales bacterium]
MIRDFGLIDVGYLMLAARWTLLLAAIAFVGGSIAGLLLTLLRVQPFAPLRWVASAWILIVQGTPLLAWLFVFYFGLALIGFPISTWLAVIAAYSLYASAYLAEIWRGALQSIPRQQWEAGSALALGFLEQLQHVIIPQAIRIAIPPTVGFLVQLIKNTSLAAVIGFVELTREGQLTNASTFKPFTVFIVVAAIYFAICFPLTQLSRNLEGRLHVARRVS